MNMTLNIAHTIKHYALICAPPRHITLYTYTYVDLEQYLQPMPPQVLTLELPALFSTISFKKSMRWRGEASFSRPVRWVLALHGDTVLPLVWAGLRGGDSTRVLRNAQQPIATVGEGWGYMSMSCITT